MFLQFTMMESQINKESGFLNAILDLGKPTIALCCYLNVNGAIRNLSLDTSTAPIFLNDFRKNIWVRVSAGSHLLA